MAQHDKLNAYVSEDALFVVQRHKQFNIPYKSVTEVSYGADVHRRVGEAIGVGAVTLGLGAMLLLVKTKKHFVGLTWMNKGRDGEPDQKGGVVFKVGKGDYRGFLTALEGKTGLTAVNTDRSLGMGGTSKP